MRKYQEKLKLGKLLMMSRQINSILPHATTIYNTYFLVLSLNFFNWKIQIKAVYASCDYFEI